MVSHIDLLDQDRGGADQAGLGPADAGRRRPVRRRPVRRPGTLLAIGVIYLATCRSAGGAPTGCAAATRPSGGGPGQRGWRRRQLRRRARRADRAPRRTEARFAEGERARCAPASADRSAARPAGRRSRRMACPPMRLPSRASRSAWRRRRDRLARLSARPRAAAQPAVRRAGRRGRRRRGLTDLGGFLDIVLDFLIYAAVPFAFALADPAANALPGRS